MMKTAKALAVTALGIALAFGPMVAASAAPATPDTATTASASPRYEYLGGVNLWEFCRKLGHRDVTNESPHTVYTWYCVRQDGSLEDINMYAACQWQYNKQWAKPAFWDEQDEYSWYCYLD
ncbi:hypothetical protein FHX81_6198 [Saccharothrix saharensis]|uniref:Secreted protein n=1 Tax=Saccharothrix saharensis TaxID=571190 RepID=A0A543JLS8_9PSEU|nr:hypothetical protein [Saccharothrix saharensis]TQM83771.1 hypothetical protein FHX81_6198 [Saccharothrix saharensis]